MDCKNCIYREKALGSTHSYCSFFKENGGEDYRSIELLFAGGLYELNATSMDKGEKRPAVTKNPHGVKNGWCNWPLNFDPIWIEDCMLYTKRKRDN